MRTGLSAGLMVLTLAAGTGTALAHAFPVKELPAANAVLKTSPARVSITFTEAVNKHFSGITVRAASGKPADNGHVVRDPHDDKVLSVGLKQPLAPGAYTVIWHALAMDGHRTHGRYRFTETP